ncbi:MAG TPA: glycosyltransferase [Chitinophagales bacterium]|nr:glycosyltransferase [Chitinophagales bacterium]
MILFSDSANQSAAIKSCAKLKIPLVTVLLPVYNAEAHVAEAIQSILSQTFRDFELLIINDGSTDRSLEIIRSFNDARIRAESNESNMKLIATLNKGIDLARGKYIARMDADDVSLPERLQKQVDFMETHSEVGVCGTWFQLFGNSGEIVKYPEKDENIRIMMLYQTPFCHPSIIFRKDVFDKYGIRFLPEFIHAEDYEAWVRLAGLTHFANIPEVLLKYRIHEQSVSAAHQKIQERNTHRIIRRAFEKAGMSISDEEVHLFREVAYSHFKAEKKFVLSAEAILVRLLESNRKTKFLPENALEQFVFDLWFHLCYNTTRLGKWVHHVYYHSPLSKLRRMPVEYRWKFALKVLLNKQ